MMERPLYYILDGDTPVAVPDLLDWARWYEDYHKRVVARTYLNRASERQNGACVNDGNGRQVYSSRTN
jgi:hypothetical protein